MYKSSFVKGLHRMNETERLRFDLLSTSQMSNIFFGVLSLLENFQQK